MQAAVFLVMVTLAAGDTDGARYLAGRTLIYVERYPYWESTAYAYEAIANLAAVDGNVDDAARLIGAADTLRSTVSSAVWPLVRSMRDGIVERVREAITADRYEQLLDEGGELGPPRILAIAAGGPGLIRTPDQRLRVFISSTLGELSAERQVARRAIEALRLTPVMFELGARPHPARALYRAYLDQSHVFLGMYWERYGWVAPDETISGLEDEYVLSGSLPRLVYVKEPAPDREDRLQELLASRAGRRHRGLQALPADRRPRAAHHR